MEWSLGPGDAEAARAIRHLITECLRGVADLGADLDSAELVVGELLSNVVTHTRSSAWVSLSWDGWHPELQVTDAGPGSSRLGGRDRELGVQPAQSLPDDPLATTGRGLYLVSRLAKQMSVDSSDGGGTTIRVVLDIVRAR